jgi:hypothetical protein
MPLFHSVFQAFFIFGCGQFSTTSKQKSSKVTLKRFKKDDNPALGAFTKCPITVHESDVDNLSTI